MQIDLTRIRISAFSTLCHRGRSSVCYVVGANDYSKLTYFISPFCFLYLCKAVESNSFTHTSSVFSTSALLLLHETQTGNTTEKWEERCVYWKENDGKRKGRKSEAPVFFLLKLERRLKTLLFKGKMSVNTNILNSFSFRSGVNPSWIPSCLEC